MLLTWSSDHPRQIVIRTFPHPTLSLNASLLLFHVHNHEHFQTKFITTYFNALNMVITIVLNVRMYFYNIFIGP